jgi:hypothetical protein|tara:strand:- start:611 stop:982 length:372 start_codon:yes stop_codon:yes gene_type:complete
MKDKEKKEPIVYVLQEVPGTRAGRPKFNIIGAQKYGKLKVLLKEDSQVVMSSGPIKYKLERLLKDFSDDDYLLLSGDPQIIFMVGAVIAKVNNGKAKSLKWDRQEQTYYPLDFNLYEKGEIDE